MASQQLLVNYSAQLMHEVSNGVSEPRPCTAHREVHVGVKKAQQSGTTALCSHQATPHLVSSGGCGRLVLKKGRAEAKLYNSVNLSYM